MFVVFRNFSRLNSTMRTPPKCRMQRKNCKWFYFLPFNRRKTRRMRSKIQSSIPPKLPKFLCFRVPCKVCSLLRRHFFLLLLSLISFFLLSLCHPDLFSFFSSTFFLFFLRQFSLFFQLVVRSAYLSTAVLTLVAITASSPQADNTVH